MVDDQILGLVFILQGHLGYLLLCGNSCAFDVSVGQTNNRQPTCVHSAFLNPSVVPWDSWYDVASGYETAGTLLSCRTSQTVSAGESLICLRFCESTRFFGRLQPPTWALHSSQHNSDAHIWRTSGAVCLSVYSLWPKTTFGYTL